MNLEALWYETSPYLYLAGGLASILFATSAVGLLFSASLVAVASALLVLRRAYRGPERERLRKYARPGQARGAWPCGRA